eukprot:maker-scaffold593_size129216-snap-gene-0.30 protein:Tk12027 transcript:maker-scaffold593_size129216-snap-gene-0.30-mRNA-1 annotation:"transmembrane and coiled-coil domain-containing protein 7"
MGDAKVILVSLADLVQPLEDKVQLISSGSQGVDHPGQALDAILKQKLPESDQTPEDVRWAFVQEILRLLVKLAHCLKRQSSETLLSVKENKDLSTALQIVIALGILPNLIPGVGLAVDKRSKFIQDCSQDAQDTPIDEKYLRLTSVATSLSGPLDESYIAAVMLSKYLGDILALFMQLGHAPLKKPLDTPPVNPDVYVMTPERYEELSKDQTLYKSQLSQILERIYPPLVVKHLLVIQSNPKGPKWVNALCGQLLSTVLMTENGVMNVIRGVMDVGGSGENVQQTHRCQIIAQVLASPPASTYQNVEAYYERVCPQLLDILALKADVEAKDFRLIACASIKAISERSLILSRRYLLDKIMDPFLKMNVGHPEPIRELSEEAIDKHVELLYLIFVTGNDPSGVFLAHLEPIILNLLDLHCSVTYGVSALKKPLSELILRYLKCSSNSDSIKALKGFAFKDLRHCGKNAINRFQLPRPTVRFTNGDGGGSVMEDNPDALDEQFYLSDDEKSIVIADLLQDSKDKHLATDFFISLLKDLSEMMGKQPDKEKTPPSPAPTNLEEKLLSFERDLDRTMLNLRKNLMIVRLLGLLSEDERIQENLMKDSEQLLEFICLTIQRCALACSDDDPEEDGSQILEAQSISMALTLLSLKTTQSDIQVDEWERLQSCLGDLAVLEKQYPNEQVRTLSRRLRQLISTHGAVLDHKNEMDTHVKNLLSKAEEVHGLSARVKEMKMEADKEKERVEKASSVGYEEALQALADPLLPVRGHGLIALTRLIEERNEVTLRSIKKVIVIFQDNLEDDDTYIYLQAINGLVACANYNPPVVIDLMTKEFALLDDRKFSGGGDKAVELRTKVGEALVRVTKDLNELTPHYKNQLLNPFLSQMNHPDFLVRASALSNLGEVCRNLKYSVGMIIDEVFMCLHQVIETDTSIEVRRAAVLVVTLILQGLGSDALKILQGYLKDIYRTLNHLRRKETDPAMLQHVHMALSEIDEAVQKFLRPERNLTKTIYVLDTPQDD